MTADNNSFVLYTNYFEILNELSTEDAGHIFKAILEYKATGNFQIPNHLLIAFKFIKNQLDIDNTKYQEKCEKAKANGLKGGRPKNQKNQTVSKKLNGYFEKHNDNENDNVNDNENVNVNENDNVFSKTKKQDPYINPIKSLFISEYEKTFNTRCYLSAQECLRLTELASEYPEIREIIPIAISKLKKISFNDISFKPKASWLLKSNNFERVMNGEFDTEDDNSWLDDWVKEGA